MRTMYLIAWGITRLAFLLLWSFAYPIGTANVWLKEKYLAS